MSISAAATAVETGLAAQVARDADLAKHAEVLFFEDFEGPAPKLFKPPRELVRDPAFAFQGGVCMASLNIKGKHVPFNTFEEIAPADVAYLRFYTRFEDGYDFGGGVKGPGLAALKDRRLASGGGAGIKPKGDDKYGGRICFDRNGEPYVYYYHMDMGKWGSNGKQNIGTAVACKPGRWYAIEMMIKANAPDKKDGEIIIWIDGELKAQHKDIHWRTVGALKLNFVNHSAYFGGDWTSPKDQKRFEDNMVVARKYIGPAQPANAPPVAAARPVEDKPALLAAKPAPKIDATPHRAALEKALQEKDVAWPQKGYFTVLGKAQRVTVSAVDGTGLTVRMQGNNLPWAWSEVSDRELARAVLDWAGERAAWLVHAGMLAAAAGDAELYEKIDTRLSQVDAAAARKLADLVGGK